MGDNKGFLTPADREFLRGEKDFTGKNAKQMRYQRRSSIRERTRDAFHDFSLLFKKLDESEREKVAEQVELRGEKRVMGGPRPPSVAVTDAIAFFYFLHEGQKQFEMSLHRALRDALRQENPSSIHQHVDVDLNLRQWSREDIQVLKERIEDGGTDALNRAEQDFLLELVPVDVLAVALDEQINPPQIRPGSGSEDEQADQPCPGDDSQDEDRSERQ